MENVCDVNHLDVDVLLPPRKRLLAGLKKQSSDDGDTVAASPSMVVCSCVTISEAASSSSPSFPSEFEARLKNLLSSHSNNPNLTPEEVVEASKAAVVNATKAAKVARAAAEEKVEIAAKAIVAANSTLDLVASFSEEAVSKETNLKKNKLKKHLPVQLLYKKYQPIENCRTGRKHKKPKSSSSFEITEVSDVGQDCLSLNNGHAVVASSGSPSCLASVRCSPRCVMKLCSRD
ncbi:hypothetical protein SESBI_45247 [Sesbania bispinosa]|nr:hypothetical protein SESBI_45247 [Sesbania bispinosa]